MRSLGLVLATSLVLACQPAEEELVADVLGPNFETGEDDEDAPKSECTPREAIGQGYCDELLGYQWDGSDCVALMGCGCNGSDCAELTETREACLSVFASHCDPCGECLATQKCVLWCGHVGFVEDLRCVDEDDDWCGEDSSQLSGICTEQVTVLPHIECTQPGG